MRRLPLLLPLVLSTLAFVSPAAWAATVEFNAATGDHAADMIVTGDGSDDRITIAQNSLGFVVSRAGGGLVAPLPAANVHPGAVDVLENGVDEDCDGRDAVNLDRDADGFPVPVHSNDRDPAIRPGAVEIRGNAVDENCDGIVAPFPPLTGTVVSTWTRESGGARNLKRATRVGRVLRYSLARPGLPVVQFLCRPPDGRTGDC
jgi:Putative metal-binding motif